MRCRDELSDQVRGAARRLEHGVGLGGVHGHARLAEHVLGARERGDGHGRVQVRPRPDADRVGVVRFDELSPRIVDAREAEFLGGALARLARPVGDAHDLDAGLGSQIRDVVLARVRPRSNDSDSQRVRLPVHNVLLCARPDAAGFSHARRFRTRGARGPFRRIAGDISRQSVAEE